MCRCGEFTLSQKVKESPILFYFYPVNYGMQCTYYSEAMNDYHDDFWNIGVTVFHVNPDSAENHEEWMERIDTKYDHIADILAVCEHCLHNIFLFLFQSHETDPFELYSVTILR